MKTAENGIRKAALGTMLLTGMAILLTGCGSSSLPEGYWTLTGMSEGDEEVKEKDLDDYGLDDAYISTDDDGSGYVVFFDVPADFTCDEDKEELVFDTGKVSYSLSGKKLTLSDKKTTMTFTKSSKDAPKKPKNVDSVSYSIKGSSKKSGSSDSSASSDMDDLLNGNDSSGSSELEDFWEGDWYGYMTLNAWDDYWEPYEDDDYPIMCRVELDDDLENGTITLWDSAMPYDDPIAKVDVSTRDGLDPVKGELMSEGGYFLDDQLEHSDWMIDPATYSEYSDYMRIDAYYYDSKDELVMDYTIHLKKWGADWSDFDQEPPKYDWYKKLVDKGESMPEEMPS